MLVMTNFPILWFNLSNFSFGFGSENIVFRLKTHLVLLHGHSWRFPDVSKLDTLSGFVSKYVVRIKLPVINIQWRYQWFGDTFTANMLFWYLD